jgi:type IX secretion system PorP/SprF family membrane protein
MNKLYGVFFCLPLLFLFLTNTAIAQQDNLPFLQNAFLINPAVCGAYKGIDIRAGYAKQWSGMAESPVSYYATGHSPLKLLGKTERLEANRWQAGGVRIYNEHAGVLSKTGFYVNYAAHLTLMKDGEGFPIYASMGAGVGMTNLRINAQDVILRQENDRLVSGNLSEWKPDADIGFLMHGRRFFAGFSALQIMQSSFSFSQSGQQLRQFYFMGGYTYIPHETLSVHFSGVYALNYLKRAITLQGIAEYKNLFQGGFYLKNANALGVILGTQVLPYMRVQYAYEASFGKIQSYNNGSHQIVMIFSLKKNDEATKILN